MSKPVIIVESPAKTKTIKSFLGDQYEVAASLGHVRDLPTSQLGVDVEHDFRPTYLVANGKRKVLAQLKKKVENAKAVYLASDPDREGEAIAWHLAQALHLRNPQRIEFNEITATAVQAALAHPRTVDMDRVNAQQARRILDRLVGYKLSPLLWKKVKRNLSAGRVQSVAVRLICEREREIEAFVPEEYWTIQAQLTPLEEPEPFLARLEQKDGQKLRIRTGEEAQAILAELQPAEYRVQKVERTDRKKFPPWPYITSTLQRDASIRLGFSAKKTMKVAQELYEGISLGSQGTVGLITYMRTDSTRVSEQATAEARQYVEGEWGRSYLPPQPRRAQARKGVQDAHEAIRPTSTFRRPDDVKPHLTDDQNRLYRLIWERFVASQMAPALLHVVTARIQAGAYTFRAQGTTVKFPGYLALTGEAEEPKDKDNSGEDDEEGDTSGRLPSLQEGQRLQLLELRPKQNFTQPPPRYSEATLVKTMEENGIGRPSTYAQILSTIVDRKYVVLEQRRFKPTALGFVVTDQLVEHFPDILDVTFTAEMEAKLDRIEQGDEDWVQVLHDFYGPFEVALEKAEKAMQRVQVEPQLTEHLCPRCGAPMLLREGRFGDFLACSAYPDCETRLPVDRKGRPVKKPPPRPAGLTCEKCGREMVIRQSRTGEEFLGCSGYPNCRHSRPLEALSAGDTPTTPERVPQTPEEKPEPLTPALPPADSAEPAPECPRCGRPLARKMSRNGPFWGCTGYPDCRYTRSISIDLGIPCPVEGCSGTLAQKSSARGKFYGCNRFPQCRFATPHKPLTRTCPRCQAPLALAQRRNEGPEVICLRDGCGYQEAVEAERA